MMDPLVVGALVGVGILAFFFLSIMFLKSFLFICRPHEILVIEGRKTQLPDGSTRDYAVIDSGRVIRIPVIENIRSMDLSTMTVDMHIQNAFSRGNIPLTVHAIANVKIYRRSGVIDNALERFLGRSQAEIQQVAKETIEGALRGVLARLTPEQVNEERATFVHVLAHEVEEDLNQLGLTIDTLNIQSVTDSVNYLDNIGRERIANVLMQAEVAESNTKREADEVAASAEASGKVAREEATANIRRAENSLRSERASLDGRARKIEERTEQAPIEARARAEIELQDKLAQVARLKLQADEVIPAEAHQVASRLEAEGVAASILAQGEATAESLRLIADAWKDAGENAEDIMMLEQVDDLLQQVATRIGEVEIEKVNLVDGGDGATLGRLAGAYPQMVSSVFDSVAATTGLSLRDVLQRPTKPSSPSSVRRGPVKPDPSKKAEAPDRFKVARFGDPVVTPTFESGTKTSSSSTSKAAVPASSTQAPALKPRTVTAPVDEDLDS